MVLPPGEYKALLSSVGKECRMMIDSAQKIPDSHQNPITSFLTNPSKNLRSVHNFLSYFTYSGQTEAPISFCNVA